MLKETEKTLYGNDRFEGYCIDLLEQISRLRKFNYTIHIVKDGSYGSLDKSTGKWNGMVGEIINGVSLFALHCFYCKNNSYRRRTWPLLH